MTDPAFLENALSRLNPDYIFNGIAYTAVDQAESEKEKACALNRAFPALLGGMTRGSRAHLIHYSTDFVFNGKKRTPYVEEDPTDPLNVYGASKLAGEQALTALDMPNCCVVRTAWLFGPGRRNFVSVMLDLARREDTKAAITVVHDQVGSPTYTGDLAAISMALAVKRASGIIHAVNAGLVRAGQRSHRTAETRCTRSPHSFRAMAAKSQAPRIFRAFHRPPHSPDGYFAPPLAAGSARLYFRHVRG